MQCYVTRPVRILHLEDDPLDAELTAAALAADGLDAEIVRVDSPDAFAAALTGGRVDLVLADYNLPQFDGIAAQRAAASLAPDVPFIFLSGTIGEELAIERLKAGATDYVLKQRLARLPSSIRRALAEARERAERRRAEDEIRRLNAELEVRVREATSLLEDLVASSPSMLFRVDPDGWRVTYASPNVGWLLGYALADVQQPGFWDARIHEDDRRRVRDEIEAALADHVAQIEQEYRFCAKDGTCLWLFTLWRVEYSEDGRAATVLGYCRDVSDRKAAEEEMKAARIEADRANRAKNDFLSRVSHELRTPMNAVLGFAELLSTDRLTAEQAESVQLILRGGRHLLALIDEILDISRIEAGQLSLSLEPVDVAETVAHAVQLVAPLAAPRRIELSIDTGCAGYAVLADRQRFNQLLLNLLSNAVKYNRTGGRVLVHFEEVPDRRLRIKVSDTGAGIPSEKLKLLFTPFERLGAAASGVDGTGLGLVVSRSLAIAMGGEMGVTSQVERGTTFWVELQMTEPVAGPAKADPVAVRDVDAASVSGLVLYIEDNPSNVRLMERILQRRPRLVLRHAPDGRTGIEMAECESPDVVLLDLHLPDMAGEDVLREMAHHRGLNAIPVVVLTADATPAQSRRLIGAGAAAYLTKPLAIGEVLRTLDDILGSVRVRDYPR